ncbi:MAG TPA: Zn-dependent hydrolase [Bacteroidales bacterium]|nr:Zn-dependent hydrolase [Bacteroidales bacterium]HON97265.1 Zn-dependent hydrolase [Bacteroidales bacterium]HOS20180.1 Zn-dependent hydrolase [Bacteroidales bacterium]HPL01908.1 Zn-dependent hydrolase [Bacteroidales bacterium]HQE77925.1 Zn-dependent hydrolase [Bacteroidales bacterium]
MKSKIFLIPMIAILLFSNACKKKTDNQQAKLSLDSLAIYSSYELKTDLSMLNDSEKQALKLMIEAANIMDELFWQQAFGDKKLMDTITNDTLRQYAYINYGPWDRLNDNKPFINGYGTKPAGANFYPQDMTKEEFEQWQDTNKTSQYTMIRRDENGKLKAIFYHEYFKEQLQKAANLLNQAASLIKDKNFSKYLSLRAQALITSDYQLSDMAWLDSKTSKIEFIIGPIESYEDGLFGYKTSFESFVLIKDVDWSKQLEKYGKLLPTLQKSLPVKEEYKKEMPGSLGDINVYDAIYYAGDCNAGSKTIAINLPNDEEVQLKKGTRKLQLKNVMQAKFDLIVIPISELLLDKSIVSDVTFTTFFQNVMFHEVAHGLGIKNTINNNGTVREALKELYSPLEEAKADITGLFLVQKLRDMGEITDGKLEENYASFVASIFRSIRFGAASAHGIANMLEFNFLLDEGAITKNNEGKYIIDFEKMKNAVSKMTERIITIQANGDYNAAKKWIDEKGTISADLQKDLNKINETKIPVDIVFQQGINVLGI